MNITLLDDIYVDLKNYLLLNSIYEPKVLKKSLQQYNKFPLVTITEEDNVFNSGDTTKSQIISSLTYEINIYSTDKVNNNTTISNVEIVRELQKLCDDIMSKEYKMNRISCRPTPNLDETIYRVTMRYTTKIYENRNRIII